VQRLFSTFPNSWPGFGLLLLRFGLGACLVYLGAADLWGQHSEPIRFALNVIAAASGIFLLAGLWTPVIGSLLALDQVWAALSLYSHDRAESYIHALLAILSASVAMLGPGAWSIDARMFGRKRFDIDRRVKKPSL
jgi:hypothetical protein